MNQIWSPSTYLLFKNDRSRPAIDLLSQISLDVAGSIIDMGCGPGNITHLIKEKWPNRNIIGIDISSEMLEEARQKYPKDNISWQKSDISSWKSSEKMALIFSNAALHWVPRQKELLLNFLKKLKDGGILGFQIPITKELHFEKILNEITSLPQWSNKFVQVKTYKDPITINEIYKVVSPHCSLVNIWTTNYFHILKGENPVTEWIKATTLSPYLYVLNDEDKKKFLNEYKSLEKKIYKKESNQKTIFKMKRLFVVAKKN